MRIAVCDDDRQELGRIAALLDEYGGAGREPVLHTEFQSATELLASMRSVEYDLLLLDVLMPGLNGMEAAREIRDLGKEVSIVFLSATPEYAVDSYQVRATSYLLKPASAARVFPILDKLLDEKRRPEAALRVTTRSRVLRLPYRRIEYMEIMAKTLYFHMTDGDVRRSPAA